MNTNQTRNYHCKDEELPVIGGYVAFTLQRDLEKFSSYSPKFNADYIAELETRTAAASELTNPKIDTAEGKAVTARLYAAASGLTDPLNRLEGYVKFAGESIPVSIADFGITSLRNKINRKDMEGVLQYLHLVTANVIKYKTQLFEQGMTDAIITGFNESAVSIAADNKMQYEILTQRMELVDNNVSVLNDLYAQISKICETGKILYKKTSPEKVKEYTFSYLITKVRHVSRSVPEKNRHQE